MSPSTSASPIATVLTFASATSPISPIAIQKDAAIELALKFKGDLSALGSLDNIQLHQGLSVGAVWTVYEVARRLGIDAAIGSDFAGQLALWQVIARVLDQGSRLSAVRLAQVHAACDVLGIRRGFDENDLYANLGWLSSYSRRPWRAFLARRQGTQTGAVSL